MLLAASPVPADSLGVQSHSWHGRRSLRKGCCTGLGEAAGALPAVRARHAALPHRQQDGGGGHVAAPGHLHGLEPGHPPLRSPQHGGLSAIHSPLLMDALMAAFFLQSKSLEVCAQLAVRCQRPAPHILRTPLPPPPPPPDVSGCKRYLRRCRWHGRPHTTLLMWSASRPSRWLTCKDWESATPRIGPRQRLQPQSKAGMYGSESLLMLHCL